MDFKRKPKLIAGLLIGGTVVLLAGGAVAASLPAPDRMMEMMALARAQKVADGSAVSSTAPSGSDTTPTAAASAAAGGVTPTPVPSTPVHRSAATSAAPTVPGTTSVPVERPQKASITYVVKPGDNLTIIAAWFKLHGYGDLYAANAKEIGANPNLIKPGERITIADGLASMSSSS